MRLFESIDPVAWYSAGGDPISMLGALPPSRIVELAADQDFHGRLQQVSEDLREYLSGERWFASEHENGPAAIAYFSPEYEIGRAHV